MLMWIASAALAAQVLPAPGSVRWEEVLPPDNSGRNYIDPASLRRDGEVVTFLMRSVGHQANEQGVASIVMRVAIHCRARTASLLAADAYGPNDSLVLSREFAPAEIQPTPLAEINSNDRLHPRVCRAQAG